MTVLFGLKDPRVKNVTVLRTEVSPDLKNARVYVSVMGDEKAQSLAMHGLRSARGFIQSQIADRLQLRFTPILSFALDQGVKLSIETSAILRQALGAEGESGSEEGPDESAVEGEQPDDSRHNRPDAGDSHAEDSGEHGSPTAATGGGAGGSRRPGGTDADIDTTIE